ncbi:MAG TPA: hypothetical protein VK254_03190 [Candidatus Bathyarchaeia archaeon]|nr:hypothetical protein [Candidatus Bathyarchaeia archaeon]
MGKHNSINEIAKIIQERCNSRRGFDELKLLLLDSGVPKDDLLDFFITPEGENFPIGISSYALKERMVLDKNFFHRLAISLCRLLDAKRRGILRQAFKNDGLVLDKEEIFNKDEIVFTVYYSDIDRTIRVNKKNIARPRLNNENDNVFSYIYENPNRSLKVDADYKLDGKVEVLKSLDDVVKNLQFFGEARRLFFPKVGDKEIEFRNPITRGELKDRGFDEKMTEDDLFPEKKSGTKRNKKSK